VLIKVIAGNPLGKTVHSWKSFTAKHIIQATNCTGPVWQADYWDRFIRDEEHYFRAAHYIAMNPVRAGLVKTADEWEWSGCARSDG
jgi:REP element-mobilizing transposase RayT